MDPMVWKYRFDKERYAKQINDIPEQQKKYSIIQQKKGHVWKESGITTQGRKEVEVGTLWLSNDRNNVTAENVLSCF